MQLKVDNFKKSMRKFATGITIAATKDKEGKYYGITINSFNSVSLAPFLVLFSLDKASSIYNEFIESKNFSISILAENQLDISTMFTKPSMVDWNKLDYILSSQNKNPIIEGSLAFFDAEIFQIIDAGDHSIIIGKVVDLGVFSDNLPLLYFEGEYRTLNRDKK